MGTSKRTNEQRNRLVKAVRTVLNGQENDSNTPDFILADFLVKCLDAWEVATRQRDEWYNVVLEPGAQDYDSQPGRVIVAAQRVDGIRVTEPSHGDCPVLPTGQVRPAPGSRWTQKVSGLQVVVQDVNSTGMVRWRFADSRKPDKMLRGNSINRFLEKMVPEVLTTPEQHHDKVPLNATTELMLACCPGGPVLKPRTVSPQTVWVKRSQALNSNSSFTDAVQVKVVSVTTDGHIVYFRRCDGDGYVYGQMLNFYTGTFTDLYVQVAPANAGRAVCQALLRQAREAAPAPDIAVVSGGLATGPQDVLCASGIQKGSTWVPKPGFSTIYFQKVRVTDVRDNGRTIDFKKLDSADPTGYPASLGVVTFLERYCREACPAVLRDAQPFVKAPSTPLVVGAIWHKASDESKIAKVVEVRTTNGVESVYYEWQDEVARSVKPHWYEMAVSNFREFFRLKKQPMPQPNSLWVEKPGYRDNDVRFNIRVIGERDKDGLFAVSGRGVTFEWCDTRYEGYDGRDSMSVDGFYSRFVPMKLTQPDVA